MVSLTCIAVGTIGKRSLLSFIDMILQPKKYGGDLPDEKEFSGLADEERGEATFASYCAQNLLKWPAHPPGYPTGLPGHFPQACSFVHYSDHT
jgi:hypothetical protein